MGGDFSELPGEAPALIRTALNGRVVDVRHAENSALVWMVWETLGSWSARPATRDTARRTGQVVDRHRLRVDGPVPGQPGRYERYVLIVSRYGGSGQWWMKPETPDGTA